MKYVPIPVEMLAVGKQLPVDIFSANGTLLLRKGQPIHSEQHKETLSSFQASVTGEDAQAWQRAYERMVHEGVRDGVDVREIARWHMPDHIRASDYVVAQPFSGGWLDLQEVLRGILYQGGLSINPLPRLAGIRLKAEQLLHEDPDDSLFCLFQALADGSLGYCATHALLCAALCELTAARLGLEEALRRSLMLAALTMNIAMARDQDAMARQPGPLRPWQRALVHAHAAAGADALHGIGVDDPNHLDLVRWHHHWDSPEALAQNRAARRLLHLADIFVARTASRKTRPGMPPVSAVKSMVLGSLGEALDLGSAMAQAVGFYPAGSYVRLAGGEVAVSVQRGERANTPWVIVIQDKLGMALGNYVCRNSAEPAFAIAEAVNFHTVRVKLSLDKVRRARERIPH